MMEIFPKLVSPASDEEIASAFVYGNENEKAGTSAVFQLVKVIAEIRKDERRKAGTEISREANRIYNNQVQDYPSNALDKVASYLRIGEPMVWKEPAR